MRMRLQLFSMKYGTFHAGLLTYYDEEPKRLPKFRGLVRISASTCRKISGAESLEEIRYYNYFAKLLHKIIIILDM